LVASYIVIAQLVLDCHQWLRLTLLIAQLDLDCHHWLRLTSLLHNLFWIVISGCVLRRWLHNLI